MFVLIFTGCGVKLPGKYIPAVQHQRSFSELDLHEDSTFTYDMFTELVKDTFYGKWYVYNDTVQLHITRPFDEDSLIKPERVISKKNAAVGDGQNRVQVIVQDVKKFTLAKVFINDATTPALLNDDAMVTVNGKITKINILFNNIRPRTFLIDSHQDNDFVIMLYDKEFIPISYKAPIRKWLLKEKRLLPLDEHNMPYKGNIYKHK
ncbi:hypothetical protein [Chitinophaga sancti]|nr:hypothetical protein [Chitinophaga sancti]SFW85845.1 hypothetical protein SAMN05661012_05799 [Chitinophaga sancti]